MLNMVREIIDLLWLQILDIFSNIPSYQIVKFIYKQPNIPLFVAYALQVIIPL